MIDLSKYLIFENNKKTFKETSKDDHDGSITYMTESQYQVISFDDVKEEHIKDLGLKSVPRSNDALLSLPDGSLVFVEFKNGYIDLKDQYDIRKKSLIACLYFLILWRRVFHIPEQKWIIFWSITRRKILLSQAVLKQRFPILSLVMQ